MEEFRKALKWFHVRLLLRLSAYAALWGLLIAVVLVIAAPWLRQTIGAPDYYLTLALPAALPIIYVLWVWLRRPSMQVIVQAADAWSGNTGAVVSAHEIATRDPDSPFVKPVVDRAIKLVRSAAVPEPRPLRWALTALLVLIGLIPLSRWAHAQMQGKEIENKEKEAAKKTDVPPEQAAELAKEAGTAAEKAKQSRATAQEKLADDIEQAARDAQAGGKDKERALREAHNLVDRARSQREQQQNRADARDALQKNEVTKELGKAIEDADPRAIEEAARKIAQELQRPDGGIDESRAEEVRRAIDQAQQKAPQDANLRRAADALKSALDKNAVKNSEAARQQLKDAMTQDGKTPQEIKDALDKLGQLDKEALKRQLEELSKQMSPLRDMDPSGKQAEELLKQIKDARISPEQAKEMAEAARELSKRLELDAETLRKMLQEGRKFEGMDDMAKELVERAKQEGKPINPDEVPQWVEKALPQEWKDLARKGDNQGKEGSGKDGSGKEGSAKEGSGKESTGKEGAGKEGTEGGGHKPNNGESTKPINGEGAKEGVDTTDTGQGKKDPDSKEETLDPRKAAEEKARREAGGAEGTGKGINTKEEEERLPRRYRETARKYFER